MSSPDSGPRGTPLREFERYATYRDLVINYEGNSEMIPIRTPDIGARGMFIHVPRYFPEGAVIKVDFRLTRTDYHVKARAEVRYCLEGVGIGVEFVDITPEDQAAIEEELQGGA